MIILLCACQEASTNATKTNSTSSTDHMNEKDTIAKEKARLKSLLSAFSRPLEDAKVNVDLSEMGALCAQGYTVEGEPIVAFAYLFKSQNEHNAVFEYLKSQHDSGKFYTLMGSNGGWLFWGYSTKEDVELEYLVLDLGSAFAGDER